jgi:hypothetical protein
MQALQIRGGQRAEPGHGRRGRVFADRFHARILRTPSEVANLRAYMLLQNLAVHHARSGDDRLVETQAHLRVDARPVRPPTHVLLFKMTSLQLPLARRHGWVGKRLLVEAHDRPALSRGKQAQQIRAASALKFASEADMPRNSTRRGCSSTAPTWSWPRGAARLRRPLPHAHPAHAL